jgi:Zn-dependent peptidase ImmA (M78 family)/transcriptional regulator with XRE-family HTH domain
MSDVNPEMIRVARLTEGWTQGQAADALGIKQPTYSKIENGLVGLTDEHLAQLAQRLSYPESFFRQPDRIWGTASPHHRRRKSVTPTRLQEIEAQLNVVRLQVRRLAQSVEIAPPFNVPKIDLDIVDDAYEAARAVRRHWRMPLGPVPSVMRALEDAGVIVLEAALPEKLDAISVWGPGESPVVLLNDNFPVDRKRQTLAHELAHLVLHTVDETEDPEREADAFAREFLMPSHEIRPELKHLQLRQLPDLKRRWKTSMRNIVYHARELGEISRDQARYMFMKLNQMYGAKTEPIPLPAEPPTLLRELLERHLNDLGYTVDELATAVNATPVRFKEMHRLQERTLRAV